jgi:hypothetical protein
LRGFEGSRKLGGDAILLHAKRQAAESEDLLTMNRQLIREKPEAFLGMINGPLIAALSTATPIAFAMSFAIKLSMSGDD